MDIISVRTDGMAFIFVPMLDVTRSQLRARLLTHSLTLFWCLCEFSLLNQLG